MPFYASFMLLLCVIPGDDAHHRHAHGDAKGHLRQDHALLAVHHGGVDLDAPVDRPGVHDDGVGLGELQFFRREAVAFEEFLAAGQQRPGHALALQAQGDDDVAVLDALFQRVADPYAHLRHVAGHQCFGADDAHFGAAQCGQGMDVRACDAGVQHVADDGDGEVGKIFFVVPDGEHVQQTLRRVRMPAITRIDDVDVRRDMLGDQIGCAGFAVAYHKNVGGHGTEVGDGVEQRLAFGGGGTGDVQVDDVGAEALGGDLKSGAGAGGVFKKQVENAFPAQQWHFFDLAVIHGDEVGSCIQYMRQGRFGQAFNRQQVDQLAVFVELGVSFIEHVVSVLGVFMLLYAALVWTSKLKLPDSLRAKASDWLAGKTSLAAANSA